MNFAFWKKKKKDPNKPVWKEWTDSILFAVVAATLIRWAFMEAYTIPTQSMENTLLINDYLFVSKLHYGPRTPHTPLQVPLTHQTLGPFKSYSELIQLPSYRFPGLSKVKRNDVVVFNNPAELERPYDLRTNYIKRCVAIAGDTIRLINGVVYVNQEISKDPAHSQKAYYLFTKRILKPEFLRKRYGVYTHSYLPEANPESSWQCANQDSLGQCNVFVLNIEMKPAHVQDLLKNKLIDSFQIAAMTRKQIIALKETHNIDYPNNIFPKSKFEWDVDNYGPLWIPKKGATIPMDSVNLDLYFHTIKYYEGYDPNTVEIVGTKLSIDGALMDNYTFSQDYFFMMGDNRHNSFDSRFIGFVPENHIVGKALFKFWSTDPDESWPNIFRKIRWNRVLRGIE